MLTESHKDQRIASCQLLRWWEAQIKESLCPWIPQVKLCHQTMPKSRAQHQEWVSRLVLESICPCHLWVTLKSNLRLCYRNLVPGYQVLVSEFLKRHQELQLSKLWLTLETVNSEIIATKWIKLVPSPHRLEQDQLQEQKGAKIVLLKVLQLMKFSMLIIMEMKFTKTQSQNQIKTSLRWRQIRRIIAVASL